MGLGYYKDVPIEQLILTNMHYDNGFYTHLSTGSLMVHPIYGSTDAVEIDNVLFWGATTKKEYVNYINKNNIKRICIENFRDTSFLRECPSIEYVTMANCYDSSGLYCLPNLKELEWAYSNNIDKSRIVPIDISRLVMLERLVCPFDKYTLNFDKAVWLKSIHVNGAKIKTLQPFANLTKLQSISIGQCALRSLEGIENFNELEWLDLYYLRSLDSMKGIELVKDTLRVLQITSLSKIKDLNFLSDLSELRYLELDGKFIIPNLGFLKQMPMLRRIILGEHVLVEDGNTEPLKNIFFHGFVGRKWYNYRYSLNQIKPITNYPQEYFTSEKVPVWRAKKLLLGNEIEERSKEMQRNEELREEWLKLNGRL